MASPTMWLATLGMLMAMTDGASLIPTSGGWKPISDPGLGSFQTLDKISSPFVAPSFGEVSSDDGVDGQCALYKVTFTQDLYFQYIQYKVDVPDLRQFTLCSWTRFSNHSNDHPIFSYAVSGQPRAIYAWVSTTSRSNYWSLSVAGHTFYRLNYPLRLHRWYHSCASWNGITGEWQLWVNAERVGRGFHNRLVGYVIPGGGVAITGQEQRQVGGGFLEGPGAPKGSGGMLGEVTLLHLFSAALAPGKAHKDHKHHHGNHHEEYPANGQPLATTPRVPPQFQHPLLVAGQIAPRGQNVIQQITASAQGTPVAGAGGALFQAAPLLVDPSGGLAQQTLPLGPDVFKSLALGEEHKLFKRQDDKKKPASKRSDIIMVAAPVSEDQEDPVTTPRYNASAVVAAPAEGNSTSESTKQKRSVEKSKRGALVGSSDDLFLSSPFLLAGPSSGLVLGEGKIVGDAEVYPREPAEAEVEAVMRVCSGCDPEPFNKAGVISWRSTPKKLYSGALYSLARPECRKF